MSKIRIPTNKEIRDFVESLPIVKQIVDWMKVHSVPGFFKVPVYDVLVFLNNEIKRDGITTRANSMAFSFFLSLFPTIILLFTLIPYLLPFFLNETTLQYFPESTAIVYQPDSTIDYNQTMLNHLRVLLPNFNQQDNLENNINDDIINFIQDITTTPRFGLLSIGFILALFFASNGMMSLMRGFEKSYPTTFVKRNSAQKRLVAIKLTFLLGFMVFASFITILLGDQFLNITIGWVDSSTFTNFIYKLLRLGLLLALVYFGNSIIYRLGAPTIRRFTWFSAGTTLATLLSIISTTVFAFYIKNFGAYNTLYGPIGTIIVVMLWIQINAMILLIGFELNTSIAVNRDLKAEREED